MEVRGGLALGAAGLGLPGAGARQGEVPPGIPGQWPALCLYPYPDLPPPFLSPPNHRREAFLTEAMSSRAPDEAGAGAGLRGTLPWQMKLGVQGSGHLYSFNKL